MHDILGDEMKALERASTSAPFSRLLPIYARVDGRSFSRFTHAMDRPFDPRMTRAMLATATHLLEATHAKAAYVQSDEISLLWSPGPFGEHFFGGKPQKMASVLAGLATAAFTHALLKDTHGLAAWADLLPHFDARVVSMPSRDHATRMFAWRGQDARRNGLNQIARSYFSSQALQGKSTGEVRQMLAEIGIETDQFPNASLNGSLLRKTNVLRALDKAEMQRIPKERRPDANALFTRSQVVVFDSRHPGIITNLEAVLFEGADPEIPRRAAA